MNENSKQQRGKSVPKRLKIKEVIESGIISINASFNNTIVSLIRSNGDVLKQVSAGTVGYKGTKKSTPYAAKMVMKQILKLAELYKMQRIAVHVKGIGPGRNAVLRSLEVANLQIVELIDKTPIPHNGCRPPKKPRG